ncbi:hypothetical protein EGM88_07325 [Aureibaculum marinum]|uniref:Viral A-type inclusion protein n=1 Tax=Aureibaculum marinum TaxID=2487930 RepID=A0A3N4NUF6_9FLAO|nr:hypothetical protein [Aureibaculum marinum]RPD97968.1 hypothetical protein EGM88_07325 [Aureibaculum marinum]
MKTKIALLLILSLLIQSCKNESKESTTEKTRMERVIAVHDELMPKMNDIGKLTTALEAKIDSTETGQTYKVAKDSLVAAYDFMMDWMKGFGDKFDSEEILEGKALSAEKEALLIEEEERVNKMKKMMLGSIANAEALLSEDK